MYLGGVPPNPEDLYRQLKDFNVLIKNVGLEISTAASPETHKETKEHGSIVVFRLSSKVMDTKDFTSCLCFNLK